MAIITDAMFSAAHTNYITTANTNKTLLLMFDGPMPTREEFEAEMYTTLRFSNVRGQYNLSSFVSWVSTKGSTCRAHCLYPTDFTAKFLGPTKLRFPFSERTEEFVKLDPGTVTWFAVMTVSSSTTHWNQSVSIYWLGIGDVGDVDSEADLILPGAIITAEDALKANDMVFNYTGF